MMVVIVLHFFLWLFFFMLFHFHFFFPFFGILAPLFLASVKAAAMAWFFGCPLFSISAILGPIFFFPGFKGIIASPCYHKSFRTFYSIQGAAHHANVFVHFARAGAH